MQSENRSRMETKKELYNLKCRSEGSISPSPSITMPNVEGTVDKSKSRMKTKSKDVPRIPPTFSTPFRLQPRKPLSSRCTGSVGKGKKRGARSDTPPNDFTLGVASSFDSLQISSNEKSKVCIKLMSDKTNQDAKIPFTLYTSKHSVRYENVGKKSDDIANANPECFFVNSNDTKTFLFETQARSQKDFATSEDESKCENHQDMLSLVPNIVSIQGERVRNAPKVRQEMVKDLGENEIFGIRGKSVLYPEKHFEVPRSIKIDNNLVERDQSVSKVDDEDLFFLATPQNFEQEKQSKLQDRRQRQRKSYNLRQNNFSKSSPLHNRKSEGSIFTPKFSHNDRINSAFFSETKSNTSLKDMAAMSIKSNIEPACLKSDNELFVECCLKRTTSVLELTGAKSQMRQVEGDEQDVLLPPSFTSAVDSPVPITPFKEVLRK